MIDSSERGQARVPHALSRILSDALDARQAYQQGRLTRRGLDRKVRGFERRVERLLAGHVRYAPNVRLLRHLANEAPHLFTFLKIDGVEATNWRAEHAIRPAVVACKVSGGNRTWRGAHTSRCSPACCGPVASRARTRSTSSPTSCASPITSSRPS
jgi:transposase